MHQFLTFAVSTPMQHALRISCARRRSIADELAPFYQARRDRFASLMAGSRFRLRPVAGTYFQLADYSEVSDLPDLQFCEELDAQARRCRDSLVSVLRRATGGTAGPFLFC